MMFQKPIPLYLFLPGILLSVLAGVAIGWKIGNRSVDAVPPEPVAEPLFVSENESPIFPIPPVSEPEKETGIDPETEMLADAGTNDFDFQTMLAELEAMDLRIVPTRFLAELNVPVLAENGLPFLTDEVVELFALGGAEVDRVNAALADAAEMLTAAEIAAAEITKISDTEVTIKLPSVGDLADQVEEELRQNILTTLGPTDGPLFLDLMEHSSGEYFNDYGRDERQYTFSATPTGDNKVELTIKTARTQPETGQFREQASHTTFLDLSWEDASARTRNFGAYGRRQDHVAAMLPDSIRKYFYVSEPFTVE